MGKIVAVVLTMLLAGMLAGQGSAETMRIASNTAPDHHYNIGAKKFADLMTERTQGRIDFKIYPAGQLGKGEREVCEGLQQGSIDLQVTSTGPLGGFSPSIIILDFPFLFRDYGHVDLVLDGPIGRRLLDDFEKANIKGLAFWENGFRHLTNSKVNVNTVDDAKGLKIRTMENKVHLASWKSAGLNPTPMAFGELFTALQQRVIDGQENPIAVTYTSKFWDAGQKYFSFTAHVYSPAVLLMNKNKFDSMSKADQELFSTTALEAAKFQRKVNRDAEEASMKDMASRGVIVNRSVDRESFRKAMMPAFDLFSGEVSKADLEKIMNAK